MSIHDASPEFYTSYMHSAALTGWCEDFRDFWNMWIGGNEL